ncbi:MAG: hypothetical protein ACO22V_07260 [Hylemonella sp.]
MLADDSPHNVVRNPEVIEAYLGDEMVRPDEQAQEQDLAVIS